MDTNAATAPENTAATDLTVIERKTKYSGTVMKTTLAGAVVDIGVGVPGVIHISQLQQEPTNRVEDVVQEGQQVEVWVKRVDPARKRIELTMIQPLGLEWRELKPGMVVRGKVTRLEKFGAFVDIGAERPGLVHISEMTHEYIKTPGDVVHEGDEIEVQVLDVNRRKKQIKLSMKALETKPEPEPRMPVARAEKQEPAEEKEEPVPTAMEMALRQAMERSKDDTQRTQTRNKRKGSGNEEIEDILSRTLKHKVRNSKA